MLGENKTEKIDIRSLLEILCYIRFGRSPRKRSKFISRLENTEINNPYKFQESRINKKKKMLCNMCQA